jgi:hypothetical protein
MAWKKNPRVTTKEQFSEGTTIDGNRIDSAMDDIVDRFNDIPYGDIRKRWVPITYVAGWTPQSPKYIYNNDPYGDPTESNKGSVFGTHHWPWLHTVNKSTEVAADTFGSAVTDDLRFSNPFRLKGVTSPGIHPFGELNSDSSGSGALVTTESNKSEHYAWTRSWFLERPSILDSIDLILETDHPDVTNEYASIFRNRFKYGTSTSDGIVPSSWDRGLVITASVDNEFSREDRNLSDIEVLRRDFVLNNAPFTPQRTGKTATDSPTYNGFGSVAVNAAPSSTVAGKVLASTAFGIHVRLHALNIPIHQNARLRVTVAIPNYGNPLSQNVGWNPLTDMGEQEGDESKTGYFSNPWYQQKVHMTMTMLEEITGG